MLNGDAMRFGSGPASGGEASVVTTKVYSSGPIDFDNASLATGVELFTLPANTLITEFWCEVTEKWENATSLTMNDFLMETDGTDDAGAGYGLYPNSFDVAAIDVWDGDKLRFDFTTDDKSLFAMLNSRRPAPIRVASECTFSFTLTFTGDQPTAGSLTWYALVAEVNA